ncbi:MAG: FAD-binding oxidoreductase [Deltaproteobacteria bacterium]|nr:FAD-binding oxidoreductase [Deltaproteobacteria bacterium]
MQQALLSSSESEYQPIQWKQIEAYALTRTTQSLFAEPNSIEECSSLVNFARRRGLTVCFRGAGYSFADMILNERHIVMSTKRLNRILSFDEQTGIMVVEPGVCFKDIYCLALPKGFILSACPGGLLVTVAGAVSGNVHGKDSWDKGNFGDQVIGIKLLTAQGETIVANRAQNSDVFRAVIGGMGLLGIVSEIQLQLKRVPSAFVQVSHVPTHDLETTLEALEESRTCSHYAIAWMDTFATGARLGRGYVTRAAWIDKPLTLSKTRFENSLRMPTKIFGFLPEKPAWKMIGPFFKPFFFRFANEAIYRASTLRGKIQRECSFPEYYFMHHMIPNINRVFRPWGFVEFQPIFPRLSCTSRLKELLVLGQKYKCQSLLCGIKMHRQDDYLLSFSGDGFSISVDLQLRGRKMAEVTRFSRQLFDHVVESGGKVYLAKDELLTKEHFEKMYPNHRLFSAIKKRLDPSCVFASDLYRRLFETTTHPYPDPAEWPAQNSLNPAVRRDR